MKLLSCPHWMTCLLQKVFGGFDEFPKYCHFELSCVSSLRCNNEKQNSKLAATHAWNLNDLLQAVNADCDNVRRQRTHGNEAHGYSRIA